MRCTLRSRTGTSVRKTPWARSTRRMRVRRCPPPSTGPGASQAGAGRELPGLVRAPAARAPHARRGRPVAARRRHGRPGRVPPRLCRALRGAWRQLLPGRPVGTRRRAAFWRRPPIAAIGSTAAARRPSGSITIRGRERAGATASSSCRRWRARRRGPSTERCVGERSRSWRALGPGRRRAIAGSARARAWRRRRHGPRQFD